MSSHRLLMLSKTIRTSTLVWLVSLIFCGCTTPGIHIETSEKQSLNYLRFAINKTAPRGVRTASENQREIYSNYFDLYDFTSDATNAHERAYAHFLILGAGRPYELIVQVISEKKQNGEYREIGLDKRRSKELAKRLEDFLAKSREDTNFVDDWRPF
jgi:hypothetical protein